MDNVISINRVRKPAKAEDPRLHMRVRVDYRPFFILCFPGFAYHPHAGEYGIVDLVEKRSGDLVFVVRFVRGGKLSTYSYLEDALEFLGPDGA